MKLARALNVIPVIVSMRLSKGWVPNDIVEFSLLSKAINPLQVPSELHHFASLVGELKPSRLMEIGTSRGGTLCILSRLATPDATIISLDLPGGEFGGGYRWFQIPILKSFAYARQKLHLLRGDSHSAEMVSEVRNVLGPDQKLDMLFIDGDHSYEGVKKDFESYSKFVRSGGMVFFHDIAEHTIQTCQVNRFWNEIKQQYRHEEVVANREQGWAGIGVLYF